MHTTHKPRALWLNLLVVLSLLVNLLPVFPAQAASQTPFQPKTEVIFEKSMPVAAIHSRRQQPDEHPADQLTDVYSTQPNDLLLNHTNAITTVIDDYYVIEWTFDTDAESWYLYLNDWNRDHFTHTLSLGHNQAGALELWSTGGSYRWTHVAMNRTAMEAMAGITSTISYSGSILSGWVKLETTENAEDADGIRRAGLRFENGPDMKTSQITTDWTKVEVVSNVSSFPRLIVYSYYLNSSSKTWWDDIELKIPCANLPEGFCAAREQPSQPDDADLSPNECPVSRCEGNTTNTAGLPINTRTGNYNYEVTDITIPTVGRPLRFERSYNSLPVTGTVVYSQSLGYGWTHNYDMNLTFPTDPGGEAGKVILHAPHGSRLRFTSNGDGTYDPYPGVWATLITGTVAGSPVYTVTAANQESYVFDDAGRLTRLIDPQGNTTTLSWTNNITLTISDPTGQRQLHLIHDPQGRLDYLLDHTGRSVDYTYNANGDLIGVNDTRGKNWTYTYSGTTHLLHEVKDPTGKVLERTFFDGGGRAVWQQDGAGDTIAQIEYLPNNQRRITESGQVFTDTYDYRGLLVGQTDALGRSQDYQLDGYFNRSHTTDIRGNPTATTRDQMGLTHQVTNALSQQTHFGYSNDGLNNLTSVTDDNGPPPALPTPIPKTPAALPPSTPSPVPSATPTTIGGNSPQRPTATVTPSTTVMTTRAI